MAAESETEVLDEDVFCPQCGQGMTWQHLGRWLCDHGHDWNHNELGQWPELANEDRQTRIEGETILFRP